MDVSDARSLDDAAERAHEALTHIARRAGQRALAVRLLLRGAPGVGGLLSYSPARRTAALRHAASEVAGAAIWIEGTWGEIDTALGGSFTLDMPSAECEGV